MRTQNSQSAIIPALEKKVAKGGITYFAGYVLGAFIAILLHILLSRWLGAEDYGLYSLTYAAFFIASYFCMLGLNWGIVKFVSIYEVEGDTRKIAGIIISAFSISTILCLALAIIMFLKADAITGIFFADTRLARPFILFFAVLAFYNISVLSGFTFQAHKNMKYYVLLRYILQYLLHLLIAGAFFILGFRLRGAIYSFMLSVIISAAISLFLLFTRLYHPKKIFKKAVFDTGLLLRFSLPLLFIGFSYLMLNQISRLFIGYLGTPSDVGIYSAAVNAVAPIVIVRCCIDAIFTPIISELHNKNKMDEIGLLLKTSTRWIFSISVLIFIPYILCARNIMGLFGAEFMVGWKSMIILAAAYFINASAGSVAYVLIMSGKQNVEVINNIAILCYNILMNIRLIKLYGILGAAMATGSSIILLNLIRLVEVKIFFNIHPYDRRYIKPVIAVSVTALMFFLFFKKFYLPETFWIISPMPLVILYVTLLLALNLEREDAFILNSLRRSLFYGKKRD
jgi:O-antigen/teichoic acid export membrane protein